MANQRVPNISATSAEVGGTVESQVRPVAAPNTMAENVVTGNEMKTTIDNARAYEVRYALIGAGGTPGPWQTAQLFTSARGMKVGGLTPGGMYTFQVRAVGGSTGYSDWSDAVSHMSL